MLKANKKTLIITSIITILPILIGLVLWSRLPDTMATHFDASNEANGFSSKLFAVFGLPVFLLLIHLAVAFITAADPKRQNISPKVFNLILWIVPACSLVCAAAIYSYNLGYRADITFFMELLVGVLFVVIGYYLPTLKQNYTVGIKLPWTLASEENWNRTHRMAGYLWMIGGVLIIIIGLTRIISAKWMIVIFLGMAVAPCVYSYWLWATGQGKTE